jgi:predicted amidohydrolase
VGSEGRSTFWEGSFLYDAFGKLIAHGGNNEEIVVGTIDLELNTIVREGWGFFRNRRPEVYGALTRERQSP